MRHVNWGERTASGAGSSVPRERVGNARDGGFAGRPEPDYNNSALTQVVPERPRVERRTEPMTI